VVDIDAPAVTIEGRLYRRVLRAPGDYHSLHELRIPSLARRARHIGPKAAAARAA